MLTLANRVMVGVLSLGVLAWAASGQAAASSGANASIDITGFVWGGLELDELPAFIPRWLQHRVVREVDSLARHSCGVRVHLACGAVSSTRGGGHTLTLAWFGARASEAETVSGLVFHGRRKGYHAERPATIAA
jgi:hypothetical protein